MDPLERVGTLAESLGRKFEPDDVTDDLRTLALDYLQGYAGDFEYLLEMRFRAGTDRRGLSDGQIKGVLNCMAAEYRRRARPAGPRVVGSAIPDGTYTVALAGDGHVTIRVRDWQNHNGAQKLEWLVGSDNESSFAMMGVLDQGTARLWRTARIYNGPTYTVGDRQRAAVNVLLQADGNLAELGLAYAIASSRCWRCNRRLTVPASVHAGLGPDCAERV